MPIAHAARLTDGLRRSGLPAGGAAASSEGARPSMTPNFLIIGAPRSGTTTLYEALRQHPDVYMSPLKEPWFAEFTGDFGPWKGPRDRQPVTDWDSYTSLFSAADGEKAVGEASTLYLYEPDAPGRIARQLPGVRLVAVLRNPVDRAFSNFLEHVQEGREPLMDFGAALRAEESRRERGWAPSWFYRDLGFYGRQIERYQEVFAPSQLRVFLYEDLMKNSDRMFSEIYEFLGIRGDFVPEMPRRLNPSGIPRNQLVHRLATQPNPLRDLLRRAVSAGSRMAIRTWLMTQNLRRPVLDPSLRAELTAGYRDDIEQLQSLLQRDLTHWLRPRDSRR